MNRLALLALPLLAACSGMPTAADFAARPSDSAVLPRDAFAGAGDPVRTAIISSNATFGQSRPLSGQPGAAARGIAQMEFLAVELPQNPNRYSASATLVPQLNTARQEWRTAFDIAPDATAQPVINALYAASRALESGQRDVAAAALPTSIFRRGGAATVAQLSALPTLPNTAAAAATAQQALMQGSPSAREF
ncbi:MAG: hypothetical protein JWR10_2904 [Rubritepida sp.]|nr:hypothetical protein [Rubritepida sp.]